MIEPVRFEQDFEQNQPVNAWERQKNEPANWYMRFRRYLDMGPHRSLRAVVATESNKEATKGNTKLSDVSVPGSWSRSAKVWNWQERAKAYDQDHQEKLTQEMRGIASSNYYSSRSMRIMELNNLAYMLKNNIKPSMEYKDFLSTIARMQSVLKDIDELMEKMGETFEEVADTAAHKHYTNDVVDKLRASAAQTGNPSKALADLAKRLQS